ncbi:MAG TPA: hypothetical protein VLF59_06215 [Candidatus Saccharimonadales bacterium]|nr:hypothetical protein [Candidatus Saccharimonadales bacterium]
MSVRMLRAGRAAAGWFASSMAWRLVLGLFLVEALWLVFSAQYPMAFDENYHFGLIQLHARQWLPFFTAQPHDASVFGAVVRDPSYLYHWLMSFPYRLISGLTDSQTAQIIFLRLINVALFGSALLLYRKVLRRIGVSAALATVLLAVFILVPVVPFLAAHINYDNLFVLVVPLAVLLAFRLMDSLREKRVDAAALLGLLATVLLACLIKYPFLPVMGVTGLFVLWQLWRAKLLSTLGLREFAASFGTLRRWKQVALVALSLVAVGLFAERYIGNVVTYHNPLPACDAVISQNECERYGPYGRDHVYAQEKSTTFHANVFSYLWQWVYGMWYRLFFAISYDYTTRPPLLAISVVSIAAAVLMVTGIVLRLRPLFAQKPYRQLVGWLVLGYGAVLFVDGFSAYKKTGQPVAINGRYLIPFLPFLFAFGGIAWAQILHRYQYWRAGIAGLVIGVFLLQGGGTMTFIIRSGDTWMWNNATVRSVNRTVRSAAWPFIIGKGIY